MGGFARVLTDEERAEIKRREERRLKEVAERRKKYAKKIVTVVVDRINHDIIRPGPKPEERECYDVANEIRELSPELISLVADIIKVTETEGL